MLFPTWPFALFFLVFYAVYLPLRRTRWGMNWLLAASYFFYGYWNPLYLVLIAYSTALDFFVVSQMEKSSRRKYWLGVSIFNNLFLLGLFKYAGFLAENVNTLLAETGLSYRLAEPDFLLPVGISFYTFQSMSYTIDYYRNEIPREKSFIVFATFVSLFPQLVAGPIERSRRLLPQLHRLAHQRIDWQDLADGGSLFVVGLFKKVALANYLGMYVDRVYRVPEQFGATDLALATFAFAWQIYFDFSGYTDMARGIGRAMGIRLMLNFNHPYLATGIADFWNRWHISLSTWFRDYVYIPLGGSQAGKWRTYRNLLLTFVVSGFWHGAAWTFVIWGALHGLAACLMRPVEGTSLYRDRIPDFCKQIATFLFVCITWIYFRATSLEEAHVIIRGIFSTDWTRPEFPLLAALLVGAVWVYQALCESRWKSWVASPVVRMAIVLFMIVYLVMIPGSQEQPFIYFQF